SKSFPARNSVESLSVLDDISLEVLESEFFCIVGPSGCGKSTIINLVAGFFPADNGKITIDHKPVTAPDSSRTVVFQEYALFPWKTVFENIEFGLKCKNVEDRERQRIVQELLKKVRLEKFTDNYPHELSGGMKQRVALARAFAVKPDIILMDEPFASLDQQTRDLLQEELINFQVELKQTILFVTHNVEEALFLGDRILVLSHRPSRIKSLVSVPFDKPRSPDIRNEKQFLDLKNKIWHSLREEIV
ncbi:ABC transporter ATP-binding protein, partial [Candidatus Kuenenbacteria bacterium CG08_land_8_20_14_0_20_37_23]